MPPGLEIMQAVVDLPSIPDFYRGRSIFVTGGSGFMGKVLVEQLLRSCPDLDTIYLLLRPKKTKVPASRLAEITSVPLFDWIKKENASALLKLVAIAGDVRELGLGMSDEDRHVLQDRVSIVFHTAATVRFDEHITDAVLTNVRGTLEVVNLALGMPNLKAFIHVSTVYCNFDQSNVLEEVYPAPGNWRTIIQLVEDDANAHLLKCLTPKILGTLPNTYTFTKALAEHVIKDHQDLLPVVIVRPSIVTASLDDPFPGWVDNFNGPTGLMMAGGKGFLRTVYMNPNIMNDYVPVDVAIKALIFIAWHRALSSNSGSSQASVYNCCSTIRRTLLDVILQAQAELVNYPYDTFMWYPNPTVTFNRPLHYFKVIFFHLLPALVIDGVLVLLKRKPMLFKLQRRVYIANITLSIFMSKNIEFTNTNFRELQTKYMKAEDRKGFSYNLVADMEPFVKSALIGTKVYLMKESLSNLPQAKKNFVRMYWLDRVCKALLALLFLWAVDACALLQSTAHYVISRPQ